MGSTSTSPSDLLLNRRRLIGAAGLAFAGWAFRAGAAPAADDNGITHTAGAIHQEPLFSASPQRLYAALTDPRQFDQIVELSGVAQAMKLPDKPSVLSARAGAAFALFGGYITGRNVELVPGKRIVQAWRAASWPTGVYSIARFELLEHAPGSKIVFDHTGFPPEEALSLADGWRAHYWEPLEKLLS